VKQFSSASCYFLFLRFKYSSQRLVFENLSLQQWFPNGVSGGTTMCVAKLKKIFKLRLMMIINN
jgi:hypothetical protein